MSTVSARPFGTLPDGSPIELYAIRVGAIELHAITLGAIITSLRVPDRHGRLADVVLGHDTLAPYLQNTPYLGAVVGRCANRIAEGRFRLDDADHQLAINEAPHHLHGGDRGFDRHRWAGRPSSRGDAVGVTFERTSPAGEEHYPGALNVAVSYFVTPDATVIVEYEATTDAPTIVNLTQHTYFNLAGETSRSILDHELTIHADSFTPIGPTRIPSGEIAHVQGTPFDFRTPARVGERIDLPDEQLRRAGGFDHNFVLSPVNQPHRPAVELRDPSSGRRLAITTSAPGLQFYSGHKLDGTITGAYGRMLDRHAGLCLESQQFPDAPNQASFPPVTLRPGERYRSTTSWHFVPALHNR